MEFFKKMFAVWFDALDLNNLTAADLDKFIPEHWDDKIRMDAERKEFWSKFEGSEGANSPIVRRDDFVAKAGDLVHVQVVSILRAAGAAKATRLRGKEEKLTFGQFNLQVDWLRHAVAFDKRGTKRALLDSIMAANSRLSDWLAQVKDDEMFAELLGLGAQERNGVANTATISTLYPNAVTSVSGLTNADTFGTAELTKIKLALSRKYALPIKTIVDGKQEIEFYACVVDDISAEHYLKNDSVWQQANREAGLRGEKNNLFTGAFGTWNSMVVYTYKGKLGRGSYLRPEAQLAATSLANAALVFGTSGDRVPYQKYFVAGATKYVGIEPNGTENTITMDAGSLNPGVDSEANIANQYTAAAHTHAQLDSGCILTNENHYANAIGFGAEIAARVWGQYPKPIREVEDYGFVTGIGIECVFGQKVIEDSNATAPNHVVLKHYSKSPFIGI
jgi:N4-gp56 family major capsid protein